MGQRGPLQLKRRSVSKAHLVTEFYPQTCDLHGGGWILSPYHGSQTQPPSPDRTNTKGIAMLVYVRSYLRVSSSGKIHQVRAHWRRWPGMTFNGHCYSFPSVDYVN